MLQPPRQPPLLSPDDTLPPVEPPSAGFILQLFIVPGVIVVIIVMVWVLFNWVVRTNNDPEEYVRALRRDNAARWQAAVNLANALRDDRHSAHELKQNHRLAQELASVLDAELIAGSSEENPLALRIYLCRALGEFEVADGLPVLIKAANTERNEKEVEVRLAALQAIALLTEHLRAANQAPALADTQIEAALLAAADSSNPRVRSAAAYAMGVVGGEAINARLVRMLDDSYPDVRYNAATWLGTHGDLASVPVLAEMLDADEMAGVAVEQRSAARDYKRSLIMANALRAARRLNKQNPGADLAPLRRAVEILRAAPIDDSLRIQAIETLNEFNASQPAPKTGNIRRPSAVERTGNNLIPRQPGLIATR